MEKLDGNFWQIKISSWKYLILFIHNNDTFEIVLHIQRKFYIFWESASSSEKVQHRQRKCYVVRESATLSEKVRCHRKCYAVRESATLSEKVLRCQRKCYVVRERATSSEKELCHQRKCYVIREVISRQRKKGYMAEKKSFRKPLIINWWDKMTPRRYGWPNGPTLFKPVFLSFFGNGFTKWNEV